MSLVLKARLPQPEEVALNRCYEDILSRMPEEPVWFDEHAVPRYCDFHPSRVANIYANEAALVEVTCQSCSRLFHVAFAGCSRVLSAEEWPSGSIGQAIREKKLDYGDPPNVWCCPAGPSMNSLPRRVIQYWRQGNPAFTVSDGHRRVVTDTRAYFTWTRHPEFEVDIDPD
uniref:hypothetical protein n=1 Tax=Bradyrhizobium sp. (strain ORS 278) TaxID=114615 RepID=UPI0012FF5094|nr:hypothetical protein [Bradyrhizobium sp. ORS 278]